MKKGILGMVTILAICSFAAAGLCATKGGKIDAKQAFEEHCAVCHANGGNTINAQKPLNKKSLETNGIKNAKGIIAKMRNPGPGMTKFDEKAISNKEAKAIADYILKTFK